MRHLLLAALIGSAILFPSGSSGSEAAPKGQQAKPHTLPTVTVTGRRPLKDIGVVKTELDSAALRDNVAQSMADVLTFNSGVFVKSYGRATLSTVSFRGTSPSHTQVSWNGMRISNPMLGMTDFSTIPSFFVDRASLLHGTSSVNETGGGLGGLVLLQTIPDVAEGFHAQYIQGIGSFRTFDEYLRVTYGNDHWTSSTRVAYSSSPNDFTYTNHDKKLNIYDDNHQIIGQYHPKEKNRSGSFKDFNALQEVYYNTLKGDRLGLSAWVTHSNRELPLLTTSYGDDREFENRQRETTLRTVVSWDHNRTAWKTGLKAGYIHTNMAYDYNRETTPGTWAAMTRSRSKINTYYGLAEGEYSPTRRLLFTASLSAHQHMVRSEDKNVILTDGDRAIVGYDRKRLELSGSLTARWQPIDRLGVSMVVREDCYGQRWAPVIPALFVDGILWPKLNLRVNASVSRNYRFPSLNDLYFLPGGNPDLRPEHGISYDCGLSAQWGRAGGVEAGGSATWFDSTIDDWIIWLPTTKGFYSPRNVKRVHAYGVELKANAGVPVARDWHLRLDGTYSWTPSVNRGEKMSPADQSVGRQLPYVPRHSATVAGRLSWKRWALVYHWCYYSERFTMSSNDYTLTGHLPTYLMSNLSLEKALTFSRFPATTHPLNLQFKLTVNNLFNEDYVTVLSRPMPGRNFEFFVALSL